MSATTSPPLRLYAPAVDRAESRDCGSQADSACGRRVSESVVQVLPGPRDDMRLILVRVDGCGGCGLFLRQQSFADGIGWFTQSSVELGDAQLGPLRAALQTCPTNLPAAGPPGAARFSTPSEFRVVG